MGEARVYVQMRATAVRILRAEEARRAALLVLADAVGEHMLRPDRDPELHAAWVSYREAIR